VKFTDRFLQNWRIAKVRRYISPGAKILDIGSADGALFRRLGPVAGAGSMGVDPTLKEPLMVNNFVLQAGYFPAAIPAAAGQFDAITMLAVLEHFPETGYDALRAGCEARLRPGGKLLITVPSQSVDLILKWLTFFRLIDGMSLEEHHGYEAGRTQEIFAPPQFRLVCHQRFQLGLNNFFAFERTAAATRPPAPTPT
jgi:2-polyprenyl-3-methyl-5-hydroxy-6-metoxy-1,4-benzoquinol methylase